MTNPAKHLPAALAAAALAALASITTFAAVIELLALLALLRVHGAAVGVQACASQSAAFGFYCTFFCGGHCNDPCR